jgi:excisionase family DNA binding protein
MSRDPRQRLSSEKPRELDPKWFTVSQVAQLLGYGETKVRTLIISGDLRSLKDGRARRVLPEWVDDYIRNRASSSDDSWSR